MDIEKLIGKKIKYVFINEEKDLVQFNAEDKTVTMYVTADCCSKSWIEHISGVDNLKDAEVLEILGRKMEKDWSFEAYNVDDKKDDHEVLKYYGLKLRTSKGLVEFEFRNESNGYYGADLDFCYTKEKVPYGFKGGDKITSLVHDF